MHAHFRSARGRWPEGAALSGHFAFYAACTDYPERVQTYDDITKRLVRWAGEQPDLRAILVIGSRARLQAPADRWSDLDLVLVTTHPQRYLDGSDWLDALGPRWLTFTEATATGGLTERRALFDGALDIDFVPLPAEDFRRMLRQGFPPAVASVLARGLRFILDKDGMAQQLIPPGAHPPASPPSEEAYLDVVHDFWYHAVWTTKKLLRGELWTAMGGHAHMQRHALLPMLVWHAKAQHGWAHETWHAGRFMESWTDARTLEELPEAFAHYDQDDLRRALAATMRLFGRVSRETADRVGYTYPREAERHVTTWIAREAGIK